MTKYFHPSTAHVVVHKIVCGIGLIAAMAVGIPAVHVVSNRISANHELQLWCKNLACASQPSVLSAEPLVVYADKAKEATQLVAKLYKVSPLSFLDMAAPQVRSVLRTPSSSGRKK